MTDTPDRPDWSAVVEGMAARARAARPPLDEEAEAERRAHRAELDAERDERRRQQHLARLAEIPPRYAEATVTDREVRRWVDGAAAGSSVSLLLTGPVGTGKTWQAFGALRELLAGGIGRCEWATVPAFLDGLRPGRPGTTDYDAVASADLLLLDDLASERVSDWTLEVLYRLVDHRWAYRLPTIFTTNTPPAEVAGLLGDRIASRLAGMTRVVPLTGDDRRRHSFDPGRQGN